MNIYLYPDGNVSGPRNFIGSNNAQYGVGTFDVATMEDLSELGVKLFVEDSIPEGFWGGVPVDVISALEVRRTYPNPIMIPDYAKNKRMASIQSELAVLDVFVPRSVEEIFAAIPECGLSDINKERVATKIALRAELATLKAA